MAEQLTIEGLWERGPREPEEAPSLPPPPPLPPPDPRQHDLLSGPHLLRFKIEEACLALDPGAVRAAHANLLAHSIGQKWGDWAADIAWLVEPTNGEESALRALSLLTTADVHFPGAPRFLCERVRGGALRRAARQLIAEGGDTAALLDGRPAGALALSAGDFVLARTLLTKACDASGNSNAKWLGLTRIGSPACWVATLTIAPAV